MKKIGKTVYYGNFFLSLQLSSLCVSYLTPLTLTTITLLSMLAPSPAITHLLALPSCFLFNLLSITNMLLLLFLFAFPLTYCSISFLSFYHTKILAPFRFHLFVLSEGKLLKKDSLVLMRAT